MMSGLLTLPKARWRLRYREITDDASPPPLLTGTEQNRDRRHSS
jgi:hypothetical protein